MAEIVKKAKDDILGLIKELLVTKEDGRIKLFLINKALMARSEHREIFQNGTYVPLEIRGTLKDHVIAFGRNFENQWAVIVVPRFLCALIKEGEYPGSEEVWKDTHLLVPDNVRVWKNVISDQEIDAGKTIKICKLLEHFPVSLLIST